MTCSLTKQFLNTLNSEDNLFKQAGFEQHSFEQKGFAYYVTYKNDHTLVEFIFGPPEFQVEMIIYTEKGKYAFRDLMQNPTISQYVRQNKYIPQPVRNIKSEIKWYLDLLKFSLAVVG